MIYNYGGYSKLGKFILSDGQYYWFKLPDDNTAILEATKDIYDADWKTASVKGNPFIPKGAKVKITDFFSNFYGEFFRISFNGYLFNAKPEDFRYVFKEEILESYESHTN